MLILMFLAFAGKPTREAEYGGCMTIRFRCLKQFLVIIQTIFQCIFKLRLSIRVFHNCVHFHARRYTNNPVIVLEILFALPNNQLISLQAKYSKKAFTQTFNVYWPNNKKRKKKIIRRPMCVEDRYKCRIIIIFYMHIFYTSSY